MLEATRIYNWMNLRNHFYFLDDKKRVTEFVQVTQLLSMVGIAVTPGFLSHLIACCFCYRRALIKENMSHTGEYQVEAKAEAEGGRHCKCKPRNAREPGNHVKLGRDKEGWSPVGFKGNMVLPTH